MNDILYDKLCRKYNYYRILYVEKIDQLKKLSSGNTDCSELNHQITELENKLSNMMKDINLYFEINLKCQEINEYKSKLTSNDEDFLEYADEVKKIYAFRYDDNN